MQRQISEADRNFEDAARIVEAFIAGKDDETVALLEQIAAAVRDKAIDD